MSLPLIVFLTSDSLSHHGTPVLEPLEFVILPFDSLIRCHRSHSVLLFLLSCPFSTSIKIPLPPSPCNTMETRLSVGHYNCHLREDQRFYVILKPRPHTSTMYRVLRKLLMISCVYVCQTLINVMLLEEKGFNV